MFKIVGRYVPPPAGVPSPLAWGTEPRLAELFGRETQALDAQRRHFVFRYRSAQHWLDTFRTYYGPTLKAFAAIDDAERKALEHELLVLAEQSNTSTTDTLRIPTEYLEVVAIKAA
jgi:hypothetical protein